MILGYEHVRSDSTACKLPEQSSEGWGQPHQYPIRIFNNTCISVQALSCECKPPCLLCIRNTGHLPLPSITRVVPYSTTPQIEIDRYCLQLTCLYIFLFHLLLLLLPTVPTESSYCFFFKFYPIIDYISIYKCILAFYQTFILICVS